MKTVSIHDAKTNLSKYIAAARQGEKIYIGSFGKQEVVLTKVTAKKRDPSQLCGKIVTTPGAFTKEADEQVAKLLYGDSL